MPGTLLPANNTRTKQVIIMVARVKLEITSSRWGVASYQPSIIQGITAIILSFSNNKLLVNYKTSSYLRN